MQYSTLIAALMAPLALAAPVSLNKRSTGTAYITNRCTFDASVNPVYAGCPNDFIPIPKGTTWSQPLIDFGGAGQGVSLKVSRGNIRDIAQVEYTVNDKLSTLFYDLSLIDGNPFGDFPQNLSTNGAGEEVFCAGGERPCKAAYTFSQEPDTKAARIGSDIHYFIC